MVYKKASSDPQSFLENARLLFRGTQFEVKFNQSNDTCDLIPRGLPVLEPMTGVPWLQICEYLFAVAISTHTWTNANNPSTLQKKRKVTDNTPSLSPPDNHPVSGKAILFTSTSCGGKLTPTVLTRRIPILSLQDKKELYFVTNTNLNQQCCSGVLVAFCENRCIDNDSSTVLESIWKLGVLLIHEYKRTMIVEAIPMLTSVSYATCCIIIFFICNTLLTLIKYKASFAKPYRIGSRIWTFKDTDNFSLRYLNTVVPGLVAFDGTVKSSVSGPDVIPLTKTMKKTIKKHSQTMPNDEPKVTDLTDKVDGLLLEFPTGTMKSRPTMARAGAHVVVIKGNSSMLSKSPTDQLTEKKEPFLLPLVLPVNCADPKTISFGLFHKGLKEYKQAIADCPKTLEDYNASVLQNSSGSVSLRAFDLSDFPNGLLFVFESDDTLDTCKVVREYDTKVPMEHWEIEGTVLSHWHCHKEFFSADKEQVELSNRVFGKQGFGNRKSVMSAGMNVYTGQRGGGRAIGNPL